jgi:hypothetical protein
MGDAGKHHMRHFVKLILNRRVQARVVVTKQIDPPGGNDVEISVSFTVEYENSFAFFDD